MGHVGVGWGGVGHLGVRSSSQTFSRGGVGHVGVSGSCRGGVGHVGGWVGNAGMGWVM